MGKEMLEKQIKAGKNSYDIDILYCIISHCPWSLIAPCPTGDNRSLTKGSFLIAVCSTADGKDFIEYRSVRRKSEEHYDNNLFRFILFGLKTWV
jgi:hypothetical protein